MHREETLCTYLPGGPDKPDEGETLAKESPMSKQSSKQLLSIIIGKAQNNLPHPTSVRWIIAKISTCTHSADVYT